MLGKATRAARNSSSIFTAASLVLSAGAAMAFTGSAEASWAATSTQAFPLKSTVASSPLAAGTPVHVTLSLKTQNKPSLDSFLTSLHTPGNPAFGKPLSPAQYVAQYAPSAAQAKQVTDYLTAQGFRNVTVSWNRQLVNADATVAQAQTAFSTSLVQFLVGNDLAFAPSTAVKVPSALGGIVQSVLGLSNVSKFTTHTLNMRAGAVPANPAAGKASTSGLGALSTLLSDVSNAPTGTGYTPAEFRQAYDVGSTPSGAGTVIAVSTCCDVLTQVIADLRQYESINNLPQVPVSVVQSSPLPATLAPSDDDEWDLDSQASSGIASNVAGIIFYNSTALMDVNAYNDFASPNPATGKPAALIGNMSYAGCEALEAVGGTLAADDQAFEEAAAQGQTWFASAGDSGAACTVLFNIVTPDSGVVGAVEYPASSPYVVAVGGTSLFTDANYNYGVEISWDAGGGGTSLFEQAPSWQQAALPLTATGIAIPSLDPGLLPGVYLLGRAVPDIAMDSAGPTAGAPELGGVEIIGAGAQIVIAGVPTEIFGTSLSSPLAVGSWARIESAHCNALGFAAPLIYALNATPSTPFSTAKGFNDVTLGTNGLYFATPGYDYTTGYGSFDIAAVNAALPAAPAGCTPGA